MINIGTYSFKTYGFKTLCGLCIALFSCLALSQQAEQGNDPALTQKLHDQLEQKMDAMIDAKLQQQYDRMNRETTEAPRQPANDMLLDLLRRLSEPLRTTNDHSTPSK